ncbi:SRPBCC family protein [Anaerolinea thermolimosa]|uniref:SRPBCC family protein n=1 Tax=Anaerolinea thermolimosa TaxID=229919 RepID=UPI000784316E|nr:SRPBCC family protein [Anaerolinea thermolimosa]
MVGIIRLNFHINAPIERVATLYQQIERIPEWQYDILEVKDVDGPLRLGAAYTMVYWRMGRRLEQRMTVTRYEPPSVMQQTANTPLGGVMTSTTHLQPSEGGTDVRWQMEYRLPGGLLGSILDKLLFRAAFERTVTQYNANFKALAEGTELPYKPIQGRVMR